jgi:hypothetical protein
MTLLCRYQGEGHLEVIGSEAQKRADRDYVVGERYAVEVQELRSAASHNHFFVSITEAWANLPEHLAERFPSPEHLRKHALVKTGYADERTIVCRSNAEATKLSGYIRSLDGYAVIVLNGTIVTAWTAKSQSMRAMGKEQFQASKDAVLAYLDQLLGLPAGEVEKAGKAA